MNLAGIADSTSWLYSPRILAEYQRYTCYGYFAAETTDGSFVGRIALHPMIMEGGREVLACANLYAGLPVAIGDCLMPAHQ